MKSQIILSAEEMKRIYPLFQGWSDSFLNKLNEKGISYLIERYQSLIDELKSGYELDISEYLNDISIRTATHTILPVLDLHNQQTLWKLISAMDAEAKPYLRERSESESYREEFNDDHPKSVLWWEHMLPKDFK